MMKFALLSLVAILLIIGCAGSDPAAQQAGKTDVAEAAADNHFPEYLVGTWRNQEHGWRITFEADGTISSVVHTMGRVELSPDEETTIPLRTGGTGTYTPGRWIASYDRANQELSVQIVLERFSAHIPGGSLESSSKDMFSGHVEKEEGLWFADWVSMPQFSLTSEEQETVSLTADDQGQQQSIIFEKTRQARRN